MRWQPPHHAWQGYFDRKEKKRKTEDEKGLTCHFPADIRSIPLDTGSYHAGIDTQAVDNGGRQWKDWDGGGKKERGEVAGGARNKSTI
jgi:hypothetical protein